MNLKHALTTVFALPLLFTACRPKPLDIDVAQKPARLTVSSAVVDEHTVFVSAAYSVSSLLAFGDGDGSRKPAGIPAGMLPDSAIVTIAGEGALPDTLKRQAAGLYSRDDLNFIAGKKYTLMVTDCRRGQTVMATTTYQPQPQMAQLTPAVQRKPGDTVVKLKLALGNVQPGDYYLVSYTTSAAMRAAANPPGKGLSALHTFTPKRLELYKGSDAVSGSITRELTLNVKAGDTLAVHAGRVDEAYFRYLDAYKRTGYLINQLTGEPINLPNNILTGYGFFALYLPQKAVFYLNDY